MFWAIVNNQRIEPKPKTYGKCPLCNEKVVSKCGQIKVWHWAHLNSSNCDPWHEQETYWHLHWKLTFGKENSEIIIKKNKKWHIADIFNKQKIVIELQNSPIQKEVINQREEFYGEKMIWLVNGSKFKNNFYIKDFDDNSHWWFNKHDNTKTKKGKKIFKWEYPRRSWENLQRNVFIDFGDNQLFWVKTGMGTSSGTGLFIHKEKFIEKYEGNYDYYIEKLSNKKNYC